MRQSDVTTGAKDNYHWIAVRSDRSMVDRLLIDVPEIVVGRRVAITSFDGSPLSPSKDEAAQGWRRVGDVLWTSIISDPKGLPLAGWDEWYIFDDEKDLSKIQVLVNYWDFCLDDPAPILESNPTWDKNLFEHQLKLQEVFWQQMQTYRPISFLAENDVSFNLATNVASLSQKVAQWFVQFCD